MKIGRKEVKRKIRKVKKEIKTIARKAKWKIKGIIRRIKKELTVGETITQTYEKIKKEHAFREIVFPSPALALVAEDPRYPRPDRGFMKYSSVILVQVRNKTWALGNGQPYGDYPVDPYSNDILAVELKNSVEKTTSEQLVKDITLSIEMSTGFSNSLIVGRGSFLLPRI